MIDIRKLKELVRLMVSNDLSEVDLRDSEEQVTLRRAGTSHAPTVTVAPVAAATPRPTAASAAPSAPTERVNADSGLVAIESPMVGTFYSRPDPDSPDFVSVGASVGPDTVVCLVEAMKIFNEIKAGMAGSIEKVVVQNGQAIEFGQTLFLVRAD